MTSVAVEHVMKCPKPIANLIESFLKKGKQSEVDCKMFFENVSRNMVLLAKFVKNDKDPNYQKHYDAVLGAFAHYRDKHKVFGGKWSTYLNDQSECWRKDYDQVWEDYSQKKLKI